MSQQSSVHKDLRPLHEILSFERIRKKIEDSQMDCELTAQVNKIVGKYQMEGCEYIFTQERNFAFFMAPFQASLLSSATDIFMDITYTVNDAYLLNVVTFNEETCLYNAAARVLASKQDGDSYAMAINKVFEVTKLHPYFGNGKNL